MDMESTDQRMPYAPASGVLAVIKRYRDRGNLPQPLTTKALHQVGVSEGNAPRTLQALKIIGLVDDEGYLTDAFKRVHQATTSEYPSTLAEIVQNAYHSIFAIVDLAQDDYTVVSDAFRYYEPSGQRPRMVKLFLSLSSEAGLIPEENREALQVAAQQSTRGQTSARSSSKQTRRTQQAKSAQPSRPAAQQRGGAADQPTLGFEADNEIAEYPAIAVLMQQLPKDGKWTNRRRRLWIQAMISAVEFSVDVVDAGDDSDRVYYGEVVPERGELENGFTE